MRILAYYIGLVVLIGCSGLSESSSSSSTPSPSYPQWFVTAPPATDSLVWAVGHAHSYIDPDDGMASARDSAYVALRRAVHHVLEGERLYEAPPRFEITSRGQHFTERELPDTLTAVSYVDSVQVEGMSLMLAAWHPERDTVPSVPDMRISFAEKRPSWVDASQTNSESGVRAVGRAPVYYRKAHTWHAAKQNAREQLALETAAGIQSMDRSDANRRHVIYRLYTAIRFSTMQVERRWSDGTYVYVLLRANIDEVLVE